MITYELLRIFHEYSYIYLIRQEILYKSLWISLNSLVITYEFIRIQYEFLCISMIFSVNIYETLWIFYEYSCMRSWFYMNPDMLAYQYLWISKNHDESLLKPYDLYSTLRYSTRIHRRILTIDSYFLWISLCFSMNIYDIQWILCVCTWILQYFLWNLMD